MLKAVIFDFDGVIADSEPLHFAAFNMALESCGVNISREKYYADYLGYSDKDCVSVINKEYSLGLAPAEQQRLIDRKGVYFDDLAIKKSSIIDGAEQFIAMLKQNNIRMAICSGALLDEIELMLKSSSFADVFESIVAADHVENGKPDPEGYLLALSNLNAVSDDKIAPSECIVVEDSHWGLEAAGKAKMNRVAVTNTYSADQLDSSAEIIVNSLADISLDDLKMICQ